MRMLTAQTLPAAGEITVLGYRLPDQSKQARLEMGVVPQLDNLDVELTARQILTVFARLYRVPRSERRQAVDAALALANLSGREHTIVRELSGGMRRRLLVARGLIHRPRARVVGGAHGGGAAPGPPGGAARRSRSCARSPSVGGRPRACAARPTWRTPSWR